MVSVIAKNIRNRRQHRGESVTYLGHTIPRGPALCELFDKTDTGGDGTISLKEYMAMCDEYGIELTDEHINDVKSISNENGEVFVYFDIKVGF